MMVLKDEYRTLVQRMEQLLLDLDRLQLATVAAHVDLGLRVLEATIANKSSTANDVKSI